MFKRLRKENEKIKMENKELRHENEMLRLELFSNNKRIAKEKITNEKITNEKITNEKLLNKIRKLTTQNCYGNERAILRKINELADRKSN